MAALLSQRWKDWGIKSWFRSCVINRVTTKKKVLLFQVLSVFAPSAHWIYFLDTATSSIFQRHETTQRRTGKFGDHMNIKRIDRRRRKKIAEDHTDRRSLQLFCYLPEDEGCGGHRMQPTWSLKTSVTSFISYIICNRLITFQTWCLQQQTALHCLMIVSLDDSPLLQHCSGLPKLVSLSQFWGSPQT